MDTEKLMDAKNLLSSEEFEHYQMISRLVENLGQFAPGTEGPDDLRAAAFIAHDAFTSLISSRAETMRIRHGLEQYSQHDASCILSQFRAGRPTENGGYELLYGLYNEGKWYPSDELPECECGLNKLLFGGEAWKK